MDTVSTVVLVVIGFLVLKAFWERMSQIKEKINRKRGKL